MLTCDWSTAAMLTCDWSGTRARWWRCPATARTPCPSSPWSARPRPSPPPPPAAPAGRAWPRPPSWARWCRGWGGARPRSPTPVYTPATDITRSSPRCVRPRGALSSEASKIIPTVLNVFENLRECYNFRKCRTYSLSRPDQLHQVITIKHIFISTHTCDNLLCF